MPETQERETLPSFKAESTNDRERAFESATFRTTISGDHEQRKAKPSVARQIRMWWYQNYWTRED